MCKTTTTTEFKVNQPIRIDGEEYVIRELDLKYFGTSEKKYAVIESQTSGAFVITHDALNREAQTARKDIYVTLDALLRDEPCEEGLKALAMYFLGESSWRGVGKFGLLKGLILSKQLNTRILVRNLYRNTTDKLYTPPTTWLQFVAKVAGLVPKESQMADHETLERLLGIK